MPEFNNIKNLWKSAEDQILANESLDIETVKRAITEQSIGITSKLLKIIRTGIFALSLSVVLFIYNIYSYAGNDLITIFSLSSLILSTLLLIFLVYQYKYLNKIDRSGLSLHDLIVNKIKYFKKSLFFVHHAMAMSTVLLVFSLNLIADNKGGNFQVNNIWLFIGLMIIAYLMVVMMLNLFHNLYLKQYRTALDDLNKTKLTEMDAELKKQKWIRLFILITVLLSVMVGLILYLKTSGNFE